MAITKRVLTPTTTNKTALVEAINKLREQKQNSNNQTKTVINQPQGTKPNTNTQFQSMSAPSYANLSNNKSYNDFLNEEIRKKAESNIPLLKPTPEKQALYDQWQNYYKSETIRKAQAGEQLLRPNEWKMQIYNQYLPQNQPEETKPPNFTYDARPTLSFDEAANRARQQLDPLYQRALENIRAQKYQNELNASEMASKRGLAHSGLAADQLTKIAIASQGQIASAEAEKAARIAELAQAMVERDQDRAFRERQQAFQEFLGNSDLGFRYDQFNYGKERDREMDNRYYDERDYNRNMQNRQWYYQLGRDQEMDKRYWDERAYQHERDKVGDDRWKQEFDYRKYLDQLQDKRAQEALAWEKEKFKTEDAWRRYVYNNMSAAEKAQLEWAKQQFGEEMAWKMFELKYNGELAKSQAQAELDYYKNFTEDEKGGGFNTKGPVPSPQSFQTHMSQAVKKYGVPASWVPALTELIRRESSFNPKAKNPKSTAYGYGQFLKSTRSAYEKKTGLDYDNPVHQIVMMAQYVKDRYGTPEKALAFWNRNRWY
jgi:hypothetical protein